MRLRVVCTAKRLPSQRCSPKTSDSLINRQKREVVVCRFALSPRHGESATSVKRNNNTCARFNEILRSMCGPRLHVQRSDRGTRSTCTNERLIPRNAGCVPFYNASWCTDPWHYSSSLIPRVRAFCVCVALPHSQLTFCYWNGESVMTKKALCAFPLFIDSALPVCGNTCYFN